MWPKFKAQEEVPEAFRDFYHEVGGEWVAKVAEGTPTQADLDALKEAARKERELTAAAEKRAKDAATRIAELERKAKAAEAGVDLDSPEVKKWREDAYKEIRTELQADIDERETRATTAEQKARGLLLDSRVKALALKNGVKKDRVDDWWALNAGHFDLDESEAPTVKDGKGKDVAAYIASDLKKARPYLYEGTQADGGGADGGTKMPGRGTGGLSFEDFQKLGPNEKLKVAREAESAA